MNIFYCKAWDFTGSAWWHFAPLVWSCLCAHLLWDFISWEGRSFSVFLQILFPQKSGENIKCVGCLHKAPNWMLHTLLSCSVLKNSSESITSGGQINNYISTAVNVRSLKRFVWYLPLEERKHLRMKIISSRIIGKSIKNRASCLIHTGYFGQAETQR